MAQPLPKVRRTLSRQTVLTYVLLGAALLLVAAVGVLVFSGGLFSDEPTSDAERDYQLLLDGLKSDPENPAVLMSLAEAEYALGKEEDALAHAADAVKFAEKQPAYRLRYANLLLRSGMVEEARVVVQEEIDLGTPGDPEPYFLMAQIDRESGDLEAAEENIKKAIDINPTSADFLAVFGSILEKQGRTEEAVRAYTEALRFVPDFEPALEGLARLGAEPPASSEATAHGGDTTP